MPEDAPGNVTDGGEPATSPGGLGELTPPVEARSIVRPDRFSLLTCHCISASVNTVQSWFSAASEISVSDFASQPPSKRASPTGQFFRGGMMPAAPSNSAHLIIFDLRSLKISAADGQAIEQELRKHLYNELSKRGLTQNRSAVDMGNAVFGIAID